MRRKAINEISEAELESLSTRQLLARLRQLLQCEACVLLSDRSNDANPTEGRIEFKDTNGWERAYRQVKHILAKREHLEKGTALTERRQQRVQRNAATERRQGKNKAVRG